MIISHKHKFIFFKPTKVAGTSIEVSLASVCGADDIVTAITLEGLDEGYVHPTRNAMVIMNSHMPPKKVYKNNKSIWDEYCKISVVRNPWDRLVSYWYWDRRFGEPPKCSFLEYSKSKELKTLTSWLTVSDKICTDFLIRFEHLDKDFASLCQLLSISPIDLPHAKGNFRTDRKPYWEYYNKEAIDSVSKKFGEDIKNFNYEFGK